MCGPDSLERSLIRAAKVGDTAALQRLVDSGVDIDYKAPWPSGGDRFWNGAPAIVLSAERGHLAAVQLLINLRADVNNKNKYPLHDSTALLAAASAGYFEIVRHLLSNGASLYVQTHRGKTNALARIAALDPTQFFGTHLQVAESLVKHGCNLSAKDENGNSAIFYTVGMNNISLFKLLLRAGADISPKGGSARDRARSVLDWEAYFGRTEMVKILLEEDPCRGHLTGNFTALHDAAMGDHGEVIRLLLDRGYNAEKERTADETALHVAARAGAVKALKLLLEEGFAIDATSRRNGRTPLLEAANMSHSTAVQVLLECGADFKVMDEYGSSARDLVRGNNRDSRVTSGLLYQAECALQERLKRSLRT